MSKIFTEQKSRNFQKPELFSGEGCVMIWKIHFQTRLTILSGLQFVSSIYKRHSIWIPDQGMSQEESWILYHTEKGWMYQQESGRSCRVLAQPEKILLLDQNLLACKERMELLEQLAASGAEVEFNGGMDVRFLNEEIIEVLRKIRVKDYHFAWDDPRELLEEKFRFFKDSV